MPHPPRPITLSLRPAALIACVAVGVWLGGLALLLCLWLFSHVLPLTTTPAPQAPAASIQAPPAVTPAPASPTAAAGSEERRRFERYLERLQQQDANDAVRRAPSALNNPKCQFWLEQQRTAPTPASQAQVETHCP